MADDIKQIIQKANEGLRREMREMRKDIGGVGVKVEAVQSELKTVAEGVVVANQRLDRLEPLVEKVEAITVDVEVIKVTVEGIKRDLKQKVDRDEFSALEVKLRPA